MLVVFHILLSVCVALWLDVCVDIALERASAAMQLFGDGVDGSLLLQTSADIGFMAIEGKRLALRLTAFRPTNMFAFRPHSCQGLACSRANEIALNLR